MKNLSIVLTQIAMHDHLYSWNNILTFKFIDWNWKRKNVIITLFYILHNLILFSWVCVVKENRLSEYINQIEDLTNYVE